MSQSAFEQSLSQPGTRVRSRHDAGLVGESTGRTRDDGDGLMAQIRFPGQQPRFEMAEDLEMADTELDDREQVLSGKFASASHLRKRLTSVQLAGQLSEMIYSLDTTDTQFMPHQFKPLLALLDSPSKGVLIADEVGLGKTIEAGLIWTELRFRTQATRLLVVCPAVLTDKWKQELYRRFGTTAQVMTAKELLRHLQQGEAAPKLPAIICSLQGIRPPTDALDDDVNAKLAVVRLARYLNDAQGQTLFDLVVIDEAHYLRNHQTSSAFLGQLLRPVADYFILLSATPVNNRSADRPLAQARSAGEPGGAQGTELPCANDRGRAGVLPARDRGGDLLWHGQRWRAGLLAGHAAAADVQLHVRCRFPLAGPRRWMERGRSGDLWLRRLRRGHGG